jgi:hypothetical protein
MKFLGSMFCFGTLMEACIGSLAGTADDRMDCCHSGRVKFWKPLAHKREIARHRDV